MLNSTERRPAFDAFFASLDEATQTVFLDEATAQRRELQQDGETYPVSLIDCMENVWDMWRELPSHPFNSLRLEERAIAHTMTCPDRKARERAYCERAGI